MSLQRLIAWVDAMCPYLGSEEVREIDDPVFQGVDWLSDPTAHQDGSDHRASRTGGLTSASARSSERDAFMHYDGCIMLTSSEMSEARQRIAAAYDPELVRGAGHRLIDQLAAQLAMRRPAAAPCFPGAIRRRMCEEAPSWLERSLPAEPSGSRFCSTFPRLVALMLQRGHNLHDPRYIGHQVPASVPLAGLFDAVGSTTNQPMAIYDMGPWATAAEWAWWIDWGS